MIKEKQKQRNMRLFIDATIELIHSEGYDNVSIRKIGDKALFNSATIYNYFKNIDHLKSIAAVGLIEKYVLELDDTIKMSKDSLELLRNVWITFLRNVYYDPKTYQILFARKNGKYTNSNMKEYYTLYPEKLNIMPAGLNDMLLGESIKARNMFLLDRCAEDGFFLKGDLEMINTQLQYIFHGLLNDLLNNDEIVYDDYMKMAQIFINNIISIYAKQ
jgi:AcrR family transcriptional regulator